MGRVLLGMHCLLIRQIHLRGGRRGAVGSLLLLLFLLFFLVLVLFLL
jgi:hypothetical protein